LLVCQVSTQLCDHATGIVEILLHRAQIGDRRRVRIELHESLDDAGGGVVALRADKIA
jgi:hypothetical protein